MAYVMPRDLKRGVRYTAIYADENGAVEGAGSAGDDDHGMPSWSLSVIR
jgi:hypothetical protein